MGVINLPPRKPPGASPNPGERRRLERLLIGELAKDFEKHGAEAIVKCRDEDPVAYLKIVASVIPKESRVEIGRDATEMTDAELIAIVRGAAAG